MGDNFYRLVLKILSTIFLILSLACMLGVLWLMVRISTIKGM